MDWRLVQDRANIPLTPLEVVMQWKIKVTLTVDADSEEQAVAKADSIIPSDVAYAVERAEPAEPRDLASDLKEDRW
jgi:hypothetical protein